MQKDTNRQARAKPTITIIRAILADALSAPSVHNTQPWKATFKNATLTISLDDKHVLKDGDPTHRQTIISLGILLEAIKISSHRRNFDCDVTPHLRDAQPYVEIHLIDSFKKPASDRQLIFLKKRASDRSIYRKVTIDPQIIAQLTSCSTKHVNVHIISDKKDINQVADLTSKGIGVAMSSPDFREELSRYLVLPWSTKKRGISVSSLYINPVLAYLQPWIVKSGFLRKKEMKLEKNRWRSASLIIVITADGDVPRYWLEAGMVYLQVSLVIESAHLSQATSAALAEASNYHEDVEEIVGTQQRTLSLLRIGLGSGKRKYSPRISVDDILST